jgi:flavin-dependent dehydrogenase
VRSWFGECLFEAPAAPGRGFALAPRRDVFDALLLDRAASAGAEVHTRTRAERLLRAADGTVVGVAVDGATGPRELYGRVVVGADGKASKVADWVGAEAYEAVPALRPGYYGYFRGVEPLPEPALEMFFGDDTLGFLFPMRPDEDCLVLELQPEDFDDFRRDPARRFLERFRRLPGMEGRLANAELEGHILGARGVDNHFRVPYGPGWALTGDAAYLKDPSTGLGMSDALVQSFLLADALARFLDGDDWDETLGEYHAARDKALMPLYRMTLDFTMQKDPPQEELAVLYALMSMPATARALAYAVPSRYGELLTKAVAARVRAAAAGFAAPAATAVP